MSRIPGQATRASAGKITALTLACASALIVASCQAANRAPSPATLTPASSTAPPVTPTSPPSPTATTPPTPTLAPVPSPQASPSVTGESNADPVLIAAGDIASCQGAGDEATAQLVEALSGTVATLGDNVYEAGTARQFAECYAPSWGTFKARTHPAPGNHDYETPGASGYFSYFGAAAGEVGHGYYGYDLGAWHIVVLNSTCWAVGGCAAGSPQEQWLRADLSAHPALCTLAYWHHPRFSSGPHGNFTAAQALWRALYDFGADIVLNGHDHDYERFAPQDPTGAADPARGIREFVVGTGGRSHYHFSDVIQPNSQARNADTFGVLKLTLHPTSYDWEFVPVAGKTFTDLGSESCHP